MFLNRSILKKFNHKNSLVDKIIFFILFKKKNKAFFHDNKIYKLTLFKALKIKTFHFLKRKLDCAFNYQNNLFQSKLHIVICKMKYQPAL